MPILIVGGQGKTGRRADALLRARRLATRCVSRSTTPRFDWTDASWWGPAMRGTAAAYVTYQPDVAVPGADEAIAAFAAVARREGLEHIVLLSGRGEPGAQRAEKALQASGLDWTIVRASWFAQNFSEGFLADGVLAGEVALPAGDVKEPFVDVDDIAEVAVAALTDARHRNQLYEVTGPQALTFAEVVAEIARVTGRPIRYQQVTPEAFAAELREAQVPDDIINLLSELFTVVLDGRNTAIAHGIERALGRQPRSIADYVKTAAAAGAWSAP